MEDNCYVEPIQKISTADEQKNTELALLAVSGMGCSNCANGVRNSLLTLYGEVYVDHPRESRKYHSIPAWKRLIA